MHVSWTAFGERSYGLSAGRSALRMCRALEQRLGRRLTSRDASQLGVLGACDTMRGVSANLVPDSKLGIRYCETEPRTQS